MTHRREDQSSWLAELLVATIAAAVAGVVWLLSTCAYRVLYRRHAAYGGRLPMIGIAIGVGGAALTVAMLVLAELYTAAVVVGLIGLFAWVGAVALLGLHYDQQERQTLERNANQSLDDILAGEPWWSGDGRQGTRQ